MVDRSSVNAAMEPPPNSNNSKSTCCRQPYGGLKMAQGFAINGTARGAVVMSNIYLSTAFVFLANQEAGCLDEDNTTILDCKGRVYGMAPSAVVSNIAVVSGILGAFFMPLFGAILDYTSHRKLVGVVATALMIAIQAVQIFTVPSTWFPMVILQAISGFLYQVEVLAIYAFLPEMARIVGEKIMTGFYPSFTALQFFSQLLYLILIVGLQLVFSWSAVTTARYSQAINTVWITVCFTASWRLMERVPPQRELRKGQWLLTEGFWQVGRTARKIYTQYRSTLGLYYAAVMFAEAAANAFTTVSVIFLADHLGLGVMDVGIFFMCALLAFIPGAYLGGCFTHWLDPRNSWRLGLSLLLMSTIAGAFGLNRSASQTTVYGWGLVTGLLLGWHYPVETLIYSLCVPKGQDAEFTGFYVYCTQIIVWLPPLIFSGLVQQGISQSFGVFAVAMFGLVAVILISLLPPWKDMRKVFEEQTVEQKEVTSHTTSMVETSMPEQAMASKKTADEDTWDVEVAA